MRDKRRRICCTASRCISPPQFLLFPFLGEHIQTIEGEVALYPDRLGFRQRLALLAGQPETHFILQQVFFHLGGGAHGQHLAVGTLAIKDQQRRIAAILDLHVRLRAQGVFHRHEQRVVLLLIVLHHNPQCGKHRRELDLAGSAQMKTAR